MFSSIKKWLALLVDEEVRSLKTENLVLRQQLSTYKFKLKRKPKITRFDRIFWCLVKEYISNWQDLLIIVKPETVVSWHKRGFKLFWKFKSRGGRPKISIEHINLIKKMATENRWGAPRIQGELKYLGINLAISTIQKYMPKFKTHKTKSQSWKTFIKNHMTESISIDFFVVPTVFFRPIYGLMVLSHKNREILLLKLLPSSNEMFVINQIKDVL